VTGEVGGDLLPYVSTASNTSPDVRAQLASR